MRVGAVLSRSSFMNKPSAQTLQETPVRRKRRGGCLGCLGQSALALLLGLLVVAAVTALLFPWAFFMGGKFNYFGFWEGVGKLHAKSGDYVLMVRIEPTPRGSRVYAASDLTGIAYLCTPRGEQFYMNLGGEMRPHLNLSTDGEGIHIYMITTGRCGTEDSSPTIAPASISVVTGRTRTW